MNNANTSPEFFVALPSDMTIGVNVNQSNVDMNVRVGFLGAQVTGGSIALSASADLHLTASDLALGGAISAASGGNSSLVTIDATDTTGLVAGASVVEITGTNSPLDGNDYTVGTISDSGFTLADTANLSTIANVTGGSWTLVTPQLVLEQA